MFFRVFYITSNMLFFFYLIMLQIYTHAQFCCFFFFIYFFRIEYYYIRICKTLSPDLFRYRYENYNWIMRVFKYRDVHLAIKIDLVYVKIVKILISQSKIKSWGVWLNHKVYNLISCLKMFDSYSTRNLVGSMESIEKRYRFICSHKNQNQKADKMKN